MILYSIETKDSSHKTTYKVKNKATEAKIRVCIYFPQTELKQQ